MGRKPKKKPGRDDRTRATSSRKMSTLTYRGERYSKKVERTPIEGTKLTASKTENYRNCFKDCNRVSTLDILLNIIKLARSTYYYHLKQLDQAR